MTEEDPARFRKLAIRSSLILAVAVVVAKVALERWVAANPGGLADWPPLLIAATNWLVRLALPIAAALLVLAVNLALGRRLSWWRSGSPWKRG